MNKVMARPWEPHLTHYPTLVLDDHATEWASRIVDANPERVELEGEELRGTAPSLEASEARALGDYAGRVWSGQASSGLW